LEKAEEIDSPNIVMHATTGGSMDIATLKNS
jgi:hypothetical protein